MLLMAWCSVGWVRYRGQPACKSLFLCVGCVSGFVSGFVVFVVVVLPIVCVFDRGLMDGWIGGGWCMWLVHVVGACGWCMWLVHVVV